MGNRKSNKRKFLVVFLCCFIVITCSENRDEITKTNSKLDISPNEKLLISGRDSLPILDLELNKYSYLLKSKLIDLFKDSLLCFYDFSLCLKGSIYVPVSYYNYNYSCPNTNFYPPLSIELNKKSEVWFHGRVIEFSEIRKEVASYFQNVGKSIYYPERFRQIILDIYWDKKNTVPEIEKFNLQIIKGYIDFIETKSKAKFKKALNQLTPNEILVLRKLYPLTIIFMGFGSIDIKPPPKSCWEAKI